MFPVETEEAVVFVLIENTCRFMARHCGDDFGTADSACFVVAAEHGLPFGSHVILVEGVLFVVLLPAAGRGRLALCIHTGHCRPFAHHRGFFFGRDFLLGIGRGHDSSFNGQESAG